MKKEIKKEKREISNDENIANLKKRKYLRYGIIFFALVTIVFAVLDLIMQNTLLLLLAIIFFIITTFLNRYRESLEIIKKDDLKEIREAIEENKKKFQRGVVEEPKKTSNKKKTNKKSSSKK